MSSVRSKAYRGAWRWTTIDARLREAQEYEGGGVAGLYQIGELARATHLSLRTLRYWEEVGLIRPSGRTTGGFRLYTDEELRRVRLVRAMKPTDFTIEELRELADVVDEVRSARQTPGERPREEAISDLEDFIGRIRARCEVLRGRLDEAETATLELERLIDERV